jgi:hypothetical protein
MASDFDWRSGLGTAGGFNVFVRPVEGDCVVDRS